MRAIWKWAVASALWLAPTCLQAASEDLAELERKAADGDAAALFALGDMHERGDGVAHDMAMAAAYMRLAAEHGSAAAQYRLGLVQAAELGVAANVTEGYKWLSLAAAVGGDEKSALLAAALRARLAARMTPAELEAAQAEVSDLQAGRRRRRAAEGQAGRRRPRHDGGDLASPFAAGRLRPVDGRGRRRRHLCD